jgi:hypothetical protein
VKVVKALYITFVFIVIASLVLLFAYYLQIAYREGALPAMKGKEAYYYGLHTYRSVVINALILSYWAVIFSIILFAVLSLFYKRPFIQKNIVLLILVTATYTLLLFSNFPVWLLGD